MSATQTFDDPQTRDELQTAVDLAEGALCLHAARQYGLVKGGPAVNIARCEKILERGMRNGILPAKDAVDRFAQAFAAEYCISNDEEERLS